MRKQKTVVVALLCFFLNAQGAGADGQTDLQSLIQYSLKHSRQMKKSDLQIKEADYALWQAIGSGLPRISDSVTYVRAESPAEVYTAGNVLQVTQLIYSQSYIAGVKTAKTMQELYATAKETKQDSIIAEVANGYYQAGSLMLQLKTIDKSIQNLNEILRIAELQYKSDFIKATDVSRLKITITNLEVTRQTVQNGIASQLNYLKAVAGMPIDTVLVIDTNTFIATSGEYSSGADFKIEDVPVYQMLMKQADVYTQQRKLSVAQYFPTIAAFGQLKKSSYNTSSDFDTWTETNAVGVMMSMPLFTSGVNYSKIRQAVLKQEQLDEDMLQARDLLRVQFDNAHSEYQTAKKLLGVQKENRDLAQKVYNQTLLQYQESMASMADLLSVNSDFLQADNSYNQQILKCKTSEIKMLKASGKLNIIIDN